SRRRQGHTAQSRAFPDAAKPAGPLSVWFPQGQSVEWRRPAGDSKVIAQYSYTHDNEDADGFARLFTEDGVFEVFVNPGGNQCLGRKETGDEGRVFASRRPQSCALFEKLTSTFLGIANNADPNPPAIRRR